MDQRLVDWARAVKARRKQGPPPLWLFTDTARLPDPLPAASTLPRGLAGVVLRHDRAPGRKRLGLALARVCRARNLGLVVAGDVRLAASLGAGVHLRAGRWPGPVRPRRGLVTSSAHNAIELRRAQRAGAALIFLSPAFPTRSHPERRGLGPIRWVSLARRAGCAVAALGGMNASTARRMSRRYCAGIGAIDALR